MTLQIISERDNNFAAVTSLQRLHFPGLDLDLEELSLVQVTETATHRLLLAAASRDAIEAQIPEWLGESGWRIHGDWSSIAGGREVRLAPVSK